MPSMLLRATTRPPASAARPPQRALLLLLLLLGAGRLCHARARGHGLAGLLRDQRRFAESEATYKRALAIRVKALPPGDSDIAETVGDYAQLLKAMGNGPAADSLLKVYAVAR